MLKKYESDLKKIQKGESVENLTEDGAKSMINGLRQVIKNKEKLLKKTAGAVV